MCFDPNARADNMLNTNENYRARIVDEQLSRYLKLFGAVEVAGTKWCGKTWTSLAQGGSVTYVDRGANLDICRADPTYPLPGDAPHVIDEWQRAPRIWDEVRHAVDDLGGQRGRWILTGSSTPLDEEKSHSGAGRIGRVRMWPMSFAESGVSSGAVSLRALFDGEFQPGECSNGVMGLVEACVRGGWPAVIDFSSADAQVTTRDYIEAVLEQSIPRLGGSARVARRLCLSLARNLGQATTQAVLACDVFGYEEKAQATQTDLTEISAHLELLRRVYLVDEIGGWVPATQSPRRMRVKPKRYFADPSIAVSLLGMSARTVLDDWQTFGLVFENACMRDLQVYARSIPEAGTNPVMYYHDDSGLEVDAVIELTDGRWAGIEIKVASTMDKVDAAAKSLLRMSAKLMKGQGRAKEPSFLMVLTGMGERAYRRPDGVLVVPLRALRA